MKKIIIPFFFFLLVCTSFFCSSSENKTDIKNDDPKQKELINFWTSFEKAILEKDVDFLISNSLNNIQCGNCGIKPDSIEIFNSKKFFPLYLDRIQPFAKVKYVVHFDAEHNNPILPLNKNQKLHYITYHLNSSEGYGLFYSIIQEKGKFKFGGMFTVP